MSVSYDSVESSVSRIMTVIDKKINTYYNYNEENIILVAKAYIKKYLGINSNNSKGSQFKTLCVTSYYIAMKYLLDNSPTLSDYTEIVGTSKHILKKKELELGTAFLFNFTPNLN